MCIQQRVFSANVANGDHDDVEDGGRDRANSRVVAMTQNPMWSPPEARTVVAAPAGASAGTASSSFSRTPSGAARSAGQQGRGRTPSSSSGGGGGGVARKGAPEDDSSGYFPVEPVTNKPAARTRSSSSTAAANGENALCGPMIGGRG